MLFFVPPGSEPPHKNRKPNNILVHLPIKLLGNKTQRISKLSRLGGVMKTFRHTSVASRVEIELNQSLAEKNRFLARMDNNACY